MAFNVRVLTYRGIRQTSEVLPKRFSSDSVFLRDEPYNSSQIVVVSGVANASIPPANEGSSPLMVLEIPDGQAVRYEINMQGAAGTGARVAGSTSPKATGTAIFHWNAGASVSLIDAAGLP
jgi:hypothetical protein